MIELNDRGVETQGMLNVVSDHWSFLGPTFKAQVPVTQRADGLYKINKPDWDATLGPLFNRISDSILHSSRVSQEYRAIANGYTAMDSHETKAFHQLLQCFSAATDPADLGHYPGTPDTNAHLAHLTDFERTYNGPEQAVLVSGTQLQGLADMGRRAFEYAQEEKDVQATERKFFGDYKGLGRVSYSNGLIPALS